MKNLPVTVGAGGATGPAEEVSTTTILLVVGIGALVVVLRTRVEETTGGATAEELGTGEVPPEAFPPFQTAGAGNG